MHCCSVWMTKLHLFVNVLAALLMSVAGAAVFVSKRAAEERHFVSPHSWAGMTVALLFTLNILQVHTSLGSTYSEDRCIRSCISLLARVCCSLLKASGRIGNGETRPTAWSGHWFTLGVP